MARFKDAARLQRDLDQAALATMLDTAERIPSQS
jgi:hypothetical protein